MHPTQRNNTYDINVLIKTQNNITKPLVQRDNTQNDIADRAIAQIKRISDFVIANNDISSLNTIKSDDTDQPSDKNKKNAIIVHVYYTDIWWNYIYPKIKAFDQNYDLYIAVTNNNSINEINKIREVCKDAKIYVVENLGEDVRSFIQIINDITDSNIDYNYILKLHTKRSSIKWLNSLLDTLFSEKALDNLKGNNGIVSNANYIGYCKNGLIDTQYFNEISNMIGSKTQLFKCAYGNMFWIKYAVLKKYINSHTLPYTYFNQRYAGGGTKMHTMERMFSAIVYDAGYNVFSID